jgi:hypothetical protein
MMGLHNRGEVPAEAEEKVVGLNVTIEYYQALQDTDYERLANLLLKIRTKF